MTRPPLTPLGAARHAIGAAPAGDLPAFPEDLAALARNADLGEERVHVAWELVRAVPQLAAEDQRALVVLLVLLFEAIAQGSTRLPISPSDRAVLRARAAALGLSRADLKRAESCADTILVGLGGKSSDTRGQLSMLFAAPAGARSPYEPLVGEPGAYRPVIVESGALVPQRLSATEGRLASRLLDRAPPRAHPDAIATALRAVLASPVVGKRGPIVLTSEQTAAVHAALSEPVAVISGGPGTGKTSIVVSMLRALARLASPEVAARDVALAAPTGKAADRLASSIRDALAACRDPIDLALRDALSEARTLHRLLGWSPSAETFRHDEDSPLAERVVIVDEASMIDLALMERLVAALRPEARLVLLGDADQLPSVEPGAVLSDLVGSGGASTITITRLTQSHRMDPRDPAGSHILGIAQAVNAGTAPRAEEGPLASGVIRRVRAPSDAGEGVSILSPRDAGAREALLSWWYRERVVASVDRTFVIDAPHDHAPLKALFDRLDASRLLCVTRGRATGADAINAWMGARLARERRLPVGPLLLVGEPVMVVRNDYDRGLFNGDQGLVLWVAERAGTSARPSLVVRRGERFVAFPLETVRPLLERAYATTVHKAQGSEHDAVALVLPDEDVPRLLTREIVYTAITRARRSVLLVGSADLLARAIARPTARTTGLGAKLRSRGA
ncbi:exodeoxyribonuclease V subunit alpha [Sandaracinus amylolyticus]|uniref:Exodeoxyribonuclease V alpha chain n=1 Tax=Sandaracinus amylolyticus TaxID=927083 RepID=A0A0F6W9W8_9BACT|nr:exodeoxyribonuclease V subunit alpha [Sandaracinus amylolyticus]AKF11123.1 Exodeoxyribonuclease V alpha chain [Sandaracinus amylolyticus]